MFRFRFVLFSIVVLLIFISGQFASGQESWWDFYDLAMQDIRAKNWSLAEERLKAAHRLQSEQGPKIRTYGARFIRYFPEYYIGVVYFHRGKHQEALEQFLRVENKGLIKQGDQEYAELTRLKQQAFAKLNPSVPAPSGPSVSEQYATLLDRSQKSLKAENYEEARNFANQAAALGTNDPKATELLGQIELAESIEQLQNAIDKNDSPAAQRLARRLERLRPNHPLLERLRDASAKKSEQENLRQYLELVEQAERQLEGGDYGGAKKTAQQAEGLPGADPAKLQTLRKKIDIREKQSQRQEQQPEEVQPASNRFEEAIKNANRELIRNKFVEAERLVREAALLPGADKQVTQNLLRRIEEGLALLSFYSGRYQDSVQVLERAAATNGASAKARFYLGCNYAALALLQQKTKEGEQAKQRLLESARREFSAARKIDSSLKYDQRFISPRILQIYERIQ